MRSIGLTAQRAICGGRNREMIYEIDWIDGSKSDLRWEE
jgi:hypothetical protein